MDDFGEAPLYVKPLNWSRDIIEEGVWINFHKRNEWFWGQEDLQPWAWSSLAMGAEQRKEDEEDDGEMKEGT